MAISLVESLTDAWDPDKYTDDYRSALLKLIHEKVEHGGKLPPGTGPKAKKPTNVIDLVSVLQESLAHTRRLAPAAKKARHSSVLKSKSKKAA